MRLTWREEQPGKRSDSSLESRGAVQSGKRMRATRKERERETI